MVHALPIIALPQLLSYQSRHHALDPLLPYDSILCLLQSRCIVVINSVEGRRNLWLLRKKRLGLGSRHCGYWACSRKGIDSRRAIGRFVLGSGRSSSSRRKKGQLKLLCHSSQGSESGSSGDKAAARFSRAKIASAALRYEEKIRLIRAVPHRLDLFFFPTSSHKHQSRTSLRVPIPLSIVFILEHTYNKRNGKDQGTQDWQQVQV
jgi:hypothetical protein